MTQEQYFHDKLVAMRQKYLEKDNTFEQEEPIDSELEKCQSVKKKIADLELQRCQLLREHRNLENVELKISKQKQRLLDLKKICRDQE